MRRFLFAGQQLSSYTVIHSILLSHSYTSSLYNSLFLSLSFSHITVQLCPNPASPRVTRAGLRFRARSCCFAIFLPASLVVPPPARPGTGHCHPLQCTPATQTLFFSLLRSKPRESRERTFIPQSQFNQEGAPLRGRESTVLEMAKSRSLRALPKRCPYRTSRRWRLTRYRPAMAFGNRKKYFRESFQSRIVTIQNISPLWKP